MSDTTTAYGVEVPEPLPPAQTFAYGPHERHRVDFWPSGAGSGPAPLLFFIHGGAWRAGDKALDTGYWKQVFFPAMGMALASINYRLVPEASVEQQAEDVAAALKAVLGRAGELGIDPQRVVLLGHSAGAHLAALLGTDEAWLRGAGLSFANIVGIIGNDGACYHVLHQLEGVPEQWRGAFIEAFGDDPERQQALSPTCNASGGNAPHFLLLHMPHRADGGITQAHDLADAVRAAGSTARVVQVDASLENGHHELNLWLGQPGHGTTAAVEEWLSEVLG